MKRKVTNLLLILAMLIGLSLLLYPSVSDFINSRNQTRVVRRYLEQTSNMSKDMYEKMISEAREYNERLYNASPEAFYHPEVVEDYGSTLDVTGTGIMGYVTIDKINVELPIYHSVDDGVLQIAVGHLPGTSLPVDGENTHIVLSGHRGLPSAMLFTDLDELQKGDIFQINVLKEQYTYEIDQVKIVLPIEVEDLQIEEGKEYCTLMTCTPYGINSHRLLVRGHRIETAIEGEPNYAVNEAYLIDPVIVMPALAIPMFIIWLIWLMVRNIEQKKRAERRERLGLSETE